MKIFYNKKMNYTIKFDEKKNQILKTIRGVGFEEVTKAIKEDKIIENMKHFNEKKYPHQFLFIIEVNNRACIVPYIKNESKKEIYLKTLYLSRKFTKIYINKIGRKYD